VLVALGATAVGGLAGGGVAVAGEAIFAPACERSFWDAFKAGGKGGLVGGAIGSVAVAWAGVLGGQGGLIGTSFEATVAEVGAAIGRGGRALRELVKPGPKLSELTYEELAAHVAANQIRMQALRQGFDSLARTAGLGSGLVIATLVGTAVVIKVINAVLGP
jgi:hypothetical protein